ncbi:MAG TPA: agmatine deiminase family protein [Candidatus Cloacimonadota bacterium]|nr:agmatine deiminase family protein [Candidatus Cloacimonadota bacterium]
MKKIHKLILFSLLLIILSIGQVFAQNMQEISPLPLTHEMSDDEIALMPAWVIDREKSNPPTGPIRPVAEFEPATKVLVRYPLGFHVNFIKLLAEEIEVLTIVSNESVKNQAIQAYTNAQVNMSNCTFVIGATNSYWTRDFGPWFSFDSNNNLSVIDFTYNRPRPLDDAFIPIYAAYDTLNCYTMSIVQTGGNYMCDGIGIAAASHIAYTENYNNQSLVNEQMQQFLGIDTYHVVQDPNNTYIDHIDCWGKFLAPDKIIIRQVPSTHPRYNALEQMAQYWANQMSSYNRPFRVYRVYTPNDQPYSNSLILNNRVFVPIMNNANDEAALQAYRDAMPGYTVYGVTNNTSNPWESTDALHCRTHEIADRRMLYISHMPLAYEQEMQNNYAIEADIISYGGADIIADSTKVFFKVNQGDYTSIDMSYFAGNLYHAEIPIPALGDTVYYYIHSVDTNNKKANHPLMGAYDPHYFVINGDDTEFPVIEHEPIAIIHENELPYTISATVTDNVGIAEVKLEFRRNESDEIYSITMSESDQNIWSCQLQSTDIISASSIYYRITATDFAQNTNYFPSEDTWILCDLDLNIEDIIKPLEKDNFIAVYPNPVNFNKSDINIKYSTSDTKRVKFEIYNIKGQKVYEFNQFNRKNDTKSIQVDLSEHVKTRLKSGVYFIKMSTNDYSVSKKIIIIK